MPQNIIQSKLNLECSTTKFARGTWRGKFSKFLSKMLWHFNRVVPNYSSINPRSVDKRVSKLVRASNQQRLIYPARYRQRLIRQRISTLMSIAEENEFELMNCT